MIYFANEPMQVKDVKKKFVTRLIQSIDNDEKVCVLTSNKGLAEQIKMRCKDVKIWTKATEQDATWVDPEFKIVICSVDDIDFHNASVFDTLYVYGEAVTNNIFETMRVIQRVTLIMKGSELFIALDATPVVPKKHIRAKGDSLTSKMYNKLVDDNELADKLNYTNYDKMFMHMLTHMCNIQM